MSDKLLSALGIPNAPYETSAKILKDNFFFNKCLAALIEEIAPAVVDTLHPSEIFQLVRRYAPTAHQPAPIPGAGVTWSVEQMPNSGVWIIRAIGPAKDMGQGTFHASGEQRFDRTPAEAAKITFMGAKVPDDILERYKQVYVPRPHGGEY